MDLIRLIDSNDLPRFEFMAAKTDLSDLQTGVYLLSDLYCSTVQI